jgi:hypothetical protein
VHTYYLIDHNYLLDEKKQYGEFGHLLAFNPASIDADMTLTFYFEDRDPVSIAQKAFAGQSTESNYGNWPVKPGQRFALQVDSTLPLACQSTIGWNVTSNDYSPKASTLSPGGIRECAKSYTAISALAVDWYLADGIVIDMADNIYVRESEWAFLLNPGDQPIQVSLAIHYKTIEKFNFTIPGKRILSVYMDDIAKRNSHYGAHFHGSAPFAAQWLRTVNWYDRDEIMAYWSVPLVPGPLK